MLDRSRRPPLVAAANAAEARLLDALLADGAVVQEVAEARQVSSELTTAHTQRDVSEPAQVDIGVRDRDVTELDVAEAAHVEEQGIEGARGAADFARTRRVDRQAASVEAGKRQP